MKVDLHFHTYRSPDSAAPPAAMIDRCLRRGIDCVAVTDHNTIAGALEMRELAPFPIIVGEEVRTSEGEIIGLFLTETVPSGLTPEETVARIRDQGGLVCIPHPFDRFRRSRLREEALERLVPQIDIMEAFNARTTLLRDSARAQAFGLQHGLALGVGSDAHTPLEVGGAYVEVGQFHGPQELLAVLGEGKRVGRRASPLVHISTKSIKWLRSLRRSWASSP